MYIDETSPSQSTQEPELESGQKAATTLLRNSAYFLGADITIKILSFLFNIYVIRQLGDMRFGAYSTALAYAGIFSILGDLGMTQYSVREIARGRKTPDDLFWNLVVVRLMLSSVALVLITSSAYFVAGYEPEMVFGIFLVCVGFLLHAFFGPVNVVLVGKERVDYVSILGTLVQVFFVTFGTWVLISGYTFYSLIIASYIGLPLAFIVGVIFIRRLKLATLKINIAPTTWWSLLKYSLPFAMITFTLVAANDLDTVLLSLWRSPEEVGWYKAAYNLIFRLLFISSAVITSLGPQMSRYYGVSKSRVAKTFNSAFKFLWAISFPIAVGVSLLSNQIIDFLYTEEYANSADILRILIWALPLLYLSYLCGQVTTASGKENKAVKVYMGALLLNLTSNIIAIPIWGYMGAAISTVLTEIAALIFFYIILHSEFPLSDLKNSILKPILAGAIMAGVILLIQSWNVIVVITIGGTIYGFSLLLLKPFNAMEMQIIQGFWLSLRRKIGWSTP